MSSLSLLLSENASLPPLRVEIKKGEFIYRQKCGQIGNKELENILRFVNTIERKYPGYKLPILFKFEDASFTDKLSYIILECICAYLIEEKNHKVRVEMKGKTSILTAGIKSSPLQLLTKGTREHLEKFKQKFKFEIYRNHFRRVVTSEDLKDQEFLSKLMDDVAWFQNLFNVNVDCREAISEVIVELVGNAGEHGGANCLVDFDIAPSYLKSGSDKEYVGINIAIVNFANELLGSALKEKICDPSITDERYSVVKQAYANHSKFFDSNYLEEDFFNLTAFQHKISGRHGSILTGGTGLTKLIESLEVRSDSHLCYVLSGTRAIHFSQKYLKYNQDGWLGFNSENDYLKAMPDLASFLYSYYKLPGTAYNLHFVLQKED